MSNFIKLLYSFGIDKKTIIRDRNDLIKFVCEVTKNILLCQQDVDFKDTDCMIKVYRIKKQGIRIFEESNNSIFSICYPFNIVDKKIQITNIDIDNMVISHVKAILDRLSQGELNFIYLDDYISKNMTETFDFWYVLYTLLTFDAGYIRYDYDEEHANDRIHPLHHLDVNYKSSFKLGLNGKMTIDDICDVLDKETNSYFLDR